MCDQMWDVTDASVVCRQLGLGLTGNYTVNMFPSFNYLSSGVQVFTQASFGEGTGMIWLTNVTCTENERVLMNCTADFSGSNSCTHAQDAGVRCSAGQQCFTQFNDTVLQMRFVVGCLEGDVRLVEGNNRREGRVEICKDNLWGTICNDGWGTHDARVVCRQLGLSVAGNFSLPWYPIYYCLLLNLTKI